MSRLFGIALFVVVLWISAELYTKGPQGAFGGVLSESTDSADEMDSAVATDPGGQANPVARTQRAAQAFERAYDESTARVDRALER